MATQRLQKIASFLGFLSLLATLLACSQAATPAPGPDYNGVGLYHTDPPASLVNGTIKYKNFSGGEIQIEARRSVSCSYGRCPIIGSPSIGQSVLKEPGAYTLELSESPKDLMVIATLHAADGKIRIAHATLTSEATEVDGVDLSLDRPYPPLR